MTSTAFDAGREMGRNWVGPNGDGSMGAMSAGFVRERAEEFAAGRCFDEFRDGPTGGRGPRRRRVRERGFHIGREAASPPNPQTPETQR